MMKRKALRQTALVMVLMAGCSGQTSDPSTELGSQAEELERVGGEEGVAVITEPLDAVSSAEQAALEPPAGDLAEDPAAAVEMAAGQEGLEFAPEQVQADAPVAQEQAQAGDALAMAQAGVEQPAAAEADVEQQEVEPEREEHAAGIDASLEATDTGLSVNELLFARSIEDRQPHEPTTEFYAEEDGRIYCYLNMKNATEEQQQVTIHWLDENGERISRLSTELDVGVSQTWRTWAFASTLADPGVYGVEVEDQGGDVIATGRFELKAAG